MRMCMECEPTITNTPQAQEELFTALCAMIPNFKFMLETAGYLPYIFTRITDPAELEVTVLRIAVYLEKCADLVNADKIIETNDRDTLLKGIKCLDFYCGVLSSPVIKEEYRPRHLHDVLTAAIESLGKIIEAGSPSYTAE